jgi:hypothetical protein
MDNWTIEAIARVHTNLVGIVFLDSGTPPAPATNVGKACLQFQTSPAVGEVGELKLIAREYGRADDNRDVYQTSISFPFDNQWHHVAVLKRATTLEYYLDYELVDSDAFLSHSDGSYRFDTNDAVCIGADMVVSGPMYTSTNVTFDEVRFTATDLDPDEFLQLPVAELTSWRKDPASTNRVVTVAARPAKNFNLEYCTNAKAGGPWTLIRAFFNTNFWSDLNLGLPASSNAIIRVRAQ